MNELFELRVYAEPSDAYEKDSRYWLLDKKISLKECEKILSDFTPPIDFGEVVAVSHTDGKRYFAPRDGFDWIDVTKTEEL